MSLKTELTCHICKLLLSSTPISLPCLHVVCNEHLRDGTVKHGSFRCLECDQEFDVPSMGFPPNKMASNILAKDLHLSEKEKKIKSSIQNLIKKLEQLQNDVKLQQNEMEVTSFEHFTKNRRNLSQIDRSS